MPLLNAFCWLYSFYVKSQQILLVHWILITQYLKAIEYLQRPVVQKSFGKYYYKFTLKWSAVPEEQILSPKKYYRVWNDGYFVDISNELFSVDWKVAITSCN